MFEMSPLPGDPGRVRSEGKRMVEAADKMRRAAATLRRLADASAYRSEAVDAMRANAHDLAQVMQKAEVRYRGAGEALIDYAPKLDAAQQKADRAIAAHGQTDVLGASAAVARTKAERLNPLLSLEEQTQAEADHHRAEAELSRQAATAKAARASYEQAVADRDTAAATAMSRIRAANERSGLDDSFWDNFRGFKEKYLMPTLEAITTVLDAVGKITTAVAILAAFVPGLQPLALALAAVGRGLAVVSMVVLVVEFALGETTLGALVAGTLFLVAGKLLKVGAEGSAAKSRLSPNDWVTGMGVKDGLRYTGQRFRHGSPLWASGFTKVGDELVIGNVKDYARGEAKDWVARQVDSMVDPETVWSTDKSVTHDVSPVGSDFSAIDPTAIIATSFAAPTDAPVTARQAVPPGAPGGGGGGRGW